MDLVYSPSIQNIEQLLWSDLKSVLPGGICWGAGNRESPCVREKLQNITRRLFPRVEIMASSADSQMDMLSLMSLCQASLVSTFSDAIFPS